MQFAFELQLELQLQLQLFFGLNSNCTLSQKQFSIITKLDISNCLTDQFILTSMAGLNLILYSTFS